MADPNDMGPRLDVEPPTLLVPSGPELDESAAAVARAMGYDVDENGRCPRAVDAMRDVGIEPTLSDVELWLWRGHVAGMYAMLGGAPADHAEEASIGIALFRADESINIALDFFPDDHPLREHLAGIARQLRELTFAHHTYCNLDEADDLEDRMRAELGD